MRAAYLIRTQTSASISYPQWIDDASCADHDPSLFELEDPVYLLKGELEERKQHERIARGLKICTGCPVRAACLNEATADDKFWSVRGGQPPEGLFRTPTSKSVTTPFSRGKKCKRQHDLWVVNSKGRNECAVCKRMQSAKDYVTRQAKKQAARLAS